MNPELNKVCKVVNKIYKYQEVIPNFLDIFAQRR